jgi:hypothetical protein
MSPSIPSAVKGAADAVQDILPFRQPAPIRSITIGRAPDDLLALWSDVETRKIAFERDELPESELRLEPAPAEWGTVVRLKVEEALPGVLVAKVLRRFKALAEASEVPTTAFNPSARPDGGEEA